LFYLKLNGRKLQIRLDYKIQN